jgi:hypothetical protein
MKHHPLPTTASLLLTLFLSGCNTATTPAPVAAPAASTSPTLPVKATMDLGVVFQGESARLNAWIKNHSDHEIQATQIEKSCECLEVTLSRTKIAPGERVLVRLHYDGAKEPDFLGSLLIDVQLNDDSGKNVGQIDVPIEVIRAEPDSNAAK